MTRLLVVAGPTASGKTALGVALAHRLGGEVISADSRQIYRGFDIGTAKPTLEEREGVPHHLFDVADPTRRYSAGEFQREGDRAIAGVVERGRLPIVVGGTGLWIRALIYGLPPLPESDPNLRAELARCPLSELVERLERIDPETAATIDRKNPVRVTRALEIHALTGERPSVLWERHRFVTPRYETTFLGLIPPRETLYPRIDGRVARMYERGLLDETRGLLEQGFGESPAFESIGYPQARACLEGRLSRDEAMDQTAQATRRYAKRQQTWFRAEAGIRWIDNIESAVRAWRE